MNAIVFAQTSGRPIVMVAADFPLWSFVYEFFLSTVLYTNILMHYEM